MIDTSFWKESQVLITGHTGFKGGWLSLWLNQTWCTSYWVCFDPPTRAIFFTKLRVESSLDRNIHGDIRDSDHFLKQCIGCSPKL